MAANYAPPRLECCRFCSVRTPSVLGGLPGWGLLCRPFSSQVGRLPLQEGLTQLHSQVAGHRFRAGFCLRFATPFSPPFTRANTHHRGTGEGALVLICEHGSEGRHKTDKPGGGIRRVQNSFWVRYYRGGRCRQGQAASGGGYATLDRSARLVVRLRLGAGYQPKEKATHRKRVANLRGYIILLRGLSMKFLPVSTYLSACLSDLWRVWCMMAGRLAPLREASVAKPRRRE